MKYIMFEDFSGHPVPVIFPKRIGHDEMREQILYSKVLAAGYIQLRQGQIICHGESRELAVKSRPEDAEIITDKLSRADA